MRIKKGFVFCVLNALLIISMFAGSNSVPVYAMTYASGSSILQDENILKDDHSGENDTRELLTADEIYSKYVNATVAIVSHDSIGQEKVGSGFFIDQGIVVTNYHVIEYANDMEIHDVNQKSYEVTGILDYDKESDLALLEVEKKNEVYFSVNYDMVYTGEDIYTLGSPEGFEGTISEGMISYAFRELEGIRYIQITAPISKNSGGGPLLNVYGEVIGVNTLTIINAQNINFSVSIEYLKQLDQSNRRDIKELFEENKGKIM